MYDCRIIDVAGNTERHITPDDIKKTGLQGISNLILITGITESSIDSAISISESPKAEETVIAGIFSGSKDMKRLHDSMDAVILSGGEDEDVIAGKISDLIAKTGFVNPDVEDITGIFSNAGTVYFGTATAKEPGTAAKKAAEACKNITRAKRVLMHITAGSEMMLFELSDASYTIEAIIDPDAQFVWGHILDDDMGDNVSVAVFAAMNDK